MEQSTRTLKVEHSNAIVPSGTKDSIVKKKVSVFNETSVSHVLPPGVV